MAEGNKKVVCVEDEPEVIDLIRLILDGRGFDFSSAIDGQAGLDLIRTVKPDLVLLDLMLPDINGWVVYQQMKTDPALKNIPVIVVTAKTQSIEKVLGLHIAKVDDYLTKPFHSLELLKSVERVLGIKEK